MFSLKRVFRNLALGLVAGLMVGNVAVASDCASEEEVQQAKYVFLFIGDGMGSPQIHAAEAYLADKSQADELAGADGADGKG